MIHIRIITNYNNNINKIYKDILDIYQISYTVVIIIIPTITINTINKTICIIYYKIIINLSTQIYNHSFNYKCLIILKNILNTNKKLTYISKPVLNYNNTININTLLNNH
jgi:hypothetical protein